MARVLKTDSPEVKIKLLKAGRVIDITEESTEHRATALIW
jgi:hypothetical protein